MRKRRENSQSIICHKLGRFVFTTTPKSTVHVWVSHQRSVPAQALPANSKGNELMPSLENYVEEQSYKIDKGFYRRQQPTYLTYLVQNLSTAILRKVSMETVHQQKLKNKAENGRIRSTTNTQICQECQSKSQREREKQQRETENITHTSTIGRSAVELQPSGHEYTPHAVPPAFGTLHCDI